ncbi:MAG: hypothetical protein LBG73_07620 [Spirochaetaceae bacterium]|nr:hypothetical protein [Spirochaetaceae bacterium]
MNISGIAISGAEAYIGAGGNARGYYAAPERTFSTPAFVLDISPEAWEAYAQSRQPSAGTAQAAAVSSPQECETCKNRRYRDGSNDPSVSFQTAAHIAPGQAAAAVAAHESEHVSHDQIKAEREGRKIISQTVTLETSTCPECGRVYVSGGRTRTVSVSAPQPEPQRVDLYA